MASFLGKSPWFFSSTWSEAWKGHFSFRRWFQETHHFSSSGRAFNKAMPQQTEFPGQWVLETYQEWEPPGRIERQAIYCLPIYNCVPPCLQSCGDVCVEGLELENAFPRNSFKGDKTQADNYVVSSRLLLLPHLPHPQQELKSKTASQAVSFQIVLAEFPEGRTPGQRFLWYCCMKRVQIQGACLMEKGCEAGMQWEPVSQYRSKPCDQVSRLLVSSGSDSFILEGCIREMYRLLLWAVCAREEERHLSTLPKLPLVWAAHPINSLLIASSFSHLSIWAWWPEDRGQHFAQNTWNVMCGWSCVCGILVPSVRGSWGWQVARNGKDQEDLKWHIRGVCKGALFSNRYFN